MSDMVVIQRLRERDLLKLAKRVCADHFVTIGQVCGRSRSLAVVAARHAVWTVLRRHARLSYPELGDLFGVDHTTVLCGVRKAQPRIDAIAARAVMRVI